MIDEAYVGIRILDLSQGIAGPCCGQMLQQLGADVVKVEPLDGDWSRRMGHGIRGMSALALAYNRGKRSVALDLRTAQGREIVRSLAAASDVVIHNFRPGAVERLGVGHEQLGRAHPRLIYAAITGYGTDGAMSEEPVTDSIAQAVSGLAMCNADADGTPRPVKPYMADLACGVYTAHAVAAALFVRERTGKGGRIAVSLLAALAALQNGMLMERAWNRSVAGLDGSESGNPGATVPQGVFRSADGYVVLASLKDDMFWKICDLLSLSSWRTDARMATAATRLAHAEDIDREISSRLRQKTSAQWAALFDGCDVLFAVVNDLDDFMEDPRTLMQGLLRDMPLTGVIDSGIAWDPGCTIPIALLPGLAAGRDTPLPSAPFIGEHTREIMMEHGYSSTSITQLAQAGVLRCRAP